MPNFITSSMKLRPVPKFLGGIFDYDHAKLRQEELASLTADADLWNNQEKALKLTSEKNTLDDNISYYEGLLSSIDNAVEMIELAEAENDENLLSDLYAHLEELKKTAKERELMTLLSGEFDKNDAYLEVHAGSGGTEAQDWAEMLLRMYSRWAEKHKYKLSYVEETEGEVAGLKSATVKISGVNAYGWLKGESGVHRLVRISPFDSNARRHTSFASINVYPVVDDTINIEINPADIKMDTYRSSGAGGQHINKTESAVRLTHIPSGVVVSCQTERSQFANRDQAMNMLKAKLYEIEQRKKNAAAEQKWEEQGDNGWGYQIRSYVLQPYKMIKDLRTNAETSDDKGVLDGDIDMFLSAYLSANA